jgi:type IV conjugative transfer system coupling protein TraD
MEEKEAQAKATISDGMEPFSTKWKMNAKAYLILGFLALSAHLFITFGVSYLFNRQVYSLVFSYLMSSAVNMQVPDVGRLAAIAKIVFYKSIGFSLLLLPVTIFAVLKAKKHFILKGIEELTDKFMRGAELKTPEEINLKIRQSGEKTSIRIGPVEMPASAEVMHSFVIGGPGSGKTTFFNQLLEKLDKRGEKRIIIYDFKGDYVSKFYNPETDILFNPLDCRSVRWTVTNEISAITDIDAIGASLIPPAMQSDPFWNDGARDVFSGLNHYLLQNNMKTNADIWSAVSAPAIQIRDWLQNTKGGERGLRYVEDASSKQAMSILSVMMQFTKSFEYLAGIDGDFCISDWISREPEKRQWIFITNYSEVEATLKPVLSLFIDLLGRKLLSLPDDLNRRIFFILDEFGTLQRLSTITRLKTLARSKGGVVFDAIQDIGQLDKIYGEATRQTIINASSTSLIFRVSDPVAAEYLSKKLGDTEIEEKRKSNTYGPEDSRDSVQVQKQLKDRRLVMASEIMNLKDLEAYLKLPNYPATKIKIDWKGYPNLNDPFLMRDDMKLKKPEN